MKERRIEMQTLFVVCVVILLSSTACYGRSGDNSVKPMDAVFPPVSISASLALDAPRWEGREYELRWESAIRNFNEIPMLGGGEMTLVFDELVATLQLESRDVALLVKIGKTQKEIGGLSQKLSYPDREHTSQSRKRRSVKEMRLAYLEKKQAEQVKELRTRLGPGRESAFFNWVLQQAAVFQMWLNLPRSGEKDEELPDWERVPPLRLIHSSVDGRQWEIVKADLERRLLVAVEQGRRNGESKRLPVGHRKP